MQSGSSVPCAVTRKFHLEVLSYFQEMAASGAYEADYVGVTENLLFEHVPYGEAVSALPEITVWLRSEGI